MVVGVHDPPVLEVGDNAFDSGADPVDLPISLATYAAQLIEDPRYSTQLDQRLRSQMQDWPY